MHFPKTIFVEQSGIIRQLFHVASEFFEVIVALCKLDYEHAIHESVDLIGSVETLIYKIAKRAYIKKGMAINISKIFVEVGEKNSKRGYYA